MNKIKIIILFLCILFILISFIKIHVQGVEIKLNCNYKGLKDNKCKEFKYPTPYRFVCIMHQEYLLLSSHPYKVLPLYDSEQKPVQCNY